MTQSDQTDSIRIDDANYANVTIAENFINATATVRLELEGELLAAVDRRIRRAKFPVCEPTRAGTVRALIIYALIDRGEM